MSQIKFLVYFLLVLCIFCFAHPGFADNSSNPCTYNYPPPGWCGNDNPCGKKVLDVSPVALGSTDDRAVFDVNHGFEEMAKNLCMYKFDPSAPELNESCNLIQSCIDSQTTSFMMGLLTNQAKGNDTCFNVENSSKVSCKMSFYVKTLCQQINYVENSTSSSEGPTMKEGIYQKCEKPKYNVFPYPGKIIGPLKPVVSDPGKPSTGSDDGDPGKPPSGSGGDTTCAAGETFDGSKCVKASEPSVGSSGTTGSSGASANSAGTTSDNGGANGAGAASGGGCQLHRESEDSGWWKVLMP